MKVIIKKTDEKVGHIEDISNELETLQKIVGGNIEPVWLGHGLVLLCNDEGLLNGSKFNARIGKNLLIFGDILVCGAEGEDFTDVPIDLPEWDEYLGRFQ